jgi:hypothetical protein
MKCITTGILLLLFNLIISAQESVYNPTQAGSQSENILLELPVSQDARIDTLMQRHIEVNKRLNGTEGFRLEIFFSSGNHAREEAMNIKTEFLKKYPDELAYMTFQSPDFKVRVGNFRTKSEALALQQRIRKDYPNAFIVKDMIQFPKLYTDKQSNE